LLLTPGVWYNVSLMKFTKMHGAGNDYLYVNAFREKVKNPGRLAVAMSDRRTGVGADGIILIAPSKKADFRMVMFNSDGSEGEMCGNGVRCIGKYVYERGLTKKTQVGLETRAGIIGLKLHARGGRVDTVTADLGPQRPVPASFYVRAGGAATRVPAEVSAGGMHWKGTVVSMGNPHFVVEVDDPASFPVATIGPLLERHPDFPSKVNVEFVRVTGKDRVLQRTWERGTGETFACGSGACAVAVALHGLGRVGPKADIDLRGGRLTIEITPDSRVLMTGPAVDVFDGEWPNFARGKSLKR
jgi:diaminopimelate epimerase